MHHNNYDDNNKSSSRSLNDISGMDAEQIGLIEDLLRSIRERIDDTYRHLCKVFPEINKEIYKTYKKAFDTLDSLTSKGPGGKIDSTISYMEDRLCFVSNHIKNYKTNDLLIAKIMDSIKSLTNSNEDNEDIGAILFEISPHLNQILEHTNNVIVLESEIMDDIESNAIQDMKSLEYTLNSSICILSDLITRSNSTKEPILKIMSGLQTHDIVNQDMDTIFTGLSVIKKSITQQSDPDDVIEALFFQERACFLSSILIEDLVDLIRGQNCIMENEIVRIQKIVSFLKEDKDTISQFLLVNKQRESTLDIVIKETSQILGDILAKLENLAHKKSNMNKSFETLKDNINRIEENALNNRAMSEDIRAVLIKTLSEIKKHISPLPDNKNDMIDALISGLFNDIEKTIQSLKEIKAVLIESIEGIDTYSKNSIDSIYTFQNKLQSVLSTLNTGDEISSCFRQMTATAGDTRSKIQGDTEISEDSIRHKTLQDILYSLSNPHSSFITGKLDNIEEGLTLF